MLDEVASYFSSNKKKELSTQNPLSGEYILQEYRGNQDLR